MGFIRLLSCLLVAFSTSRCQLVVNVRNNGGDVYRENIEANTTLDTILLEFRKTDGTLVTQFIDGRNEVQIFRIVVLPEEELGQTNIQTFCIVQRFAKNEFISSDAMSKLRQKNPSTVRHPEEIRPMETFVLDVTLNVAASHVLSSHVVNMCGDAKEMTYARSSDLQLLAQILNRDYAILQTVTLPAPVTNLTSCADTVLNSPQMSLPQSSSLFPPPCLCHYDVCVGWYPCGLKYCRGKDSAGRIVNYRCGIKTCSHCRRFEFRVAAKSLCIWDEPEFRLPDGLDANPDSDRSRSADPNRNGVAGFSEAQVPGNPFPFPKDNVPPPSSQPSHKYVANGPAAVKTDHKVAPPSSRKKQIIDDDDEDGG